VLVGVGTPLNPLGRAFQNVKNAREILLACAQIGVSICLPIIGKLFQIVVDANDFCVLAHGQRDAHMLLYSHVQV